MGGDVAGSVAVDTAQEEGQDDQADCGDGTKDDRRQPKMADARQGAAAWEPILTQFQGDRVPRCKLYLNILYRPTRGANSRMSPAGGTRCDELSDKGLNNRPGWQRRTGPDRNTMMNSEKWEWSGPHERGTALVKSRVRSVRDE